MHPGFLQQMNKIKKRATSYDAALCDPDRIQTCNLLIRSQMLYSVELRNRFRIVVVSITCAKVELFFDTASFEKKKIAPKTFMNGLLVLNASFIMNNSLC